MITSDKKLKEITQEYTTPIKAYEKQINLLGKAVTTGVLSVGTIQAIQQDVLLIQDKIVNLKLEQKKALVPFHEEKKKDKVVKKKITDKELLPFVQEDIKDLKTAVAKAKKDLKGTFFKQNKSRFVRDFTEEQQGQLNDIEKQHKEAKRKILDDAKETHKEDIIRGRLGIKKEEQTTITEDPNHLEELIAKTTVKVIHGDKGTDAKMIIELPEPLDEYFSSTIRAQYDTITAFIQGDLEGNRTKKVKFILMAIFSKPDNESPKQISKEVFLNSVLATDVLDLDAVMKQGNELFNRDEGESGLFFVGFKYVTILTYNTQMSIGGEYIDVVERFSANSNLKKNIVNVKNDEYPEVNNACFRFAVMAHEHNFPKDASRVSKYYKKKTGWIDSDYDFSMFTDYTLPTTDQQVKHFLKENKNTSISIYGIEAAGKFHVLRHEKSPKEDHINLLFHDNHYMLIKNLSKMMGDNNKYVCPKCLSVKKDTKKEIDAHLESCNEKPTQRTQMARSAIIEFSENKMKNKEMKPFIITADFESFLDTRDQDTSYSKTKIKTQTGKDETTILQTHRAASFSLKLVPDTSLNFAGKTLYTYTPSDQDDAVEYETDLLGQFNNACQEIAEDVAAFMTTSQKEYGSIDSACIAFTAEDKDRHEEAKKCAFCNKTFNFQNIKVRDHCHLTGKYRRALCSWCNLNNKTEYNIPIYFHNARGYDNNYIFKMLKQYDSNGVNVLNTNSQTTMLIKMDKYTKVKVNHGKEIKNRKISFQVKDSLQVMSSSLDTLLKNLPHDQKVHQLDYIKTAHRDIDVNDKGMLDLLLGKGVFPYSYFDSPKKLSGSLPSKDLWYDCLRQDDIKQEDYDKACRVWNTLKCKTFKDYHDFYLNMDVLGLADVLQAQRKNLHTTHKLDICHYCSLPSFSYDAWLLKQQEDDVKMKTLKDPELYELFEDQKRGGFTCTVKRHCKANNKHTRSADNQGKEGDTHLLYIDANNLYGWAMCKKLPYDDFKLIECKSLDSGAELHRGLTPEETEKMIADYNPESDTGYALEVDLEYPLSLHDKHWDFPLAPYNRTVRSGELSDYQRKVLDDEKHAEGGKLIADFKDRVKQTYNIEYLQFLLRQGLKLTKVHRIVSFKQDNIMKPYIDKNSALRAQAKNDFEKDLYKLLNNSIYGKTLENVRGRTEMKNIPYDKTKWVKGKEVPMTEEEIKEYIAKHQSKPFFNCNTVDLKSSKILQFMQGDVTLDKPVYIGSQILDYSKLLMNSFFYDTLIPHFGRENVTMAYTDTDSFVLEITTKDLDEELAKLSADFDFSNYPTTHELYDVNSKKVPGKFKDELAGDVMVEFIGLRAKCYAYSTIKKNDDNKAKGIAKSVSKTLNLDTYRSTLESHKKHVVTINSIEKRDHELHTVRSQKIALSAFDDKRYICEDGVTTKAYR